MIWTPARGRVRVPAVGSTAASGAALKRIAQWAEDGQDFMPVILYDQPTHYVAGWDKGDIVATQGDAHIHVDSHGVVKDVVPNDTVAALQAAG
jgi:hypothetical protein